MRNDRAQDPPKSAFDEFAAASKLNKLSKDLQSALKKYGDVSASPLAMADIPKNFFPLYIAAGAKFHVPWQVLAAIGRVESSHGRNPNAYHPNSAGAVGPMQFLPSTFRGYSWAAESPRPNILDPHDSIYSAAALLSRNGAPNDMHRAVFDYNHSNSYVDLVFGWARRYGWKS